MTKNAPRKQIRQEVLVHGAAEVARVLGMDETKVREIAPEEARRWDERDE